MQPTDYYQILGLDRKAEAHEIREAYRQLAFKYHPDRNADDPASAERMKALNEAYAVLHDERKRHEYNALQQQFGTSAHGQFRQSHSEEDIFTGSDIQQVFEEMARSFGVRGFDDMFKEFYGQGYRRFECRHPRGRRGPGFGGRGRGFGGRGRGFGGRGHFGRDRCGPMGVMGAMGAVPLHAILGHLGQFVFKKLSTADWPQDGRDVSTQISLQPSQALRGGRFEYQIPKRKKKVIVTIPPGIRPGQQIRLAGMGAVGKGGGKPGDLYLKIRVKTSLPRKIQRFIGQLRS